jgi:hypothetical protein
MTANPSCALRAPVLWLMTLALISTAQAGPRYRILHGFRMGKNDGGGLYGSLVFDARGNLYGVTEGGGTSGYGTAFELAPHRSGHWSEKVIYDFDCHNNEGCMPSVGLAIDPAGNLYGNTTTATFELTPGQDGWSLTILGNDGGGAGWILDQAGNLYGPLGPGQYDEGDVSELVKGQNWADSRLYSFCAKGYPCVDGAEPDAAVTWGPNGSLYGTTKSGGKAGYGVVFQLIPQQDGTWSEKLLHSFPATANDGRTLYDSVILDKAGNLYSATYQAGGGDHDCGVIFKLSPQANGTWKEDILYDFPNPSLGCSANTPTFDAKGNIWGTAYGGKYGYGVVFELSPQKNGKWNYNVVHQFNGTDGASPASAVIFDKKGNLYGTTVLGGPGSSVGVVFEITP